MAATEHDALPAQRARHVFHGVVGVGRRLHLMIDHQLCHLGAVDGDERPLLPVRCDARRDRLQVIGYDAVQRRLVVRARDGSSQRLVAGESWSS